VAGSGTAAGSPNPSTRSGRTRSAGYFGSLLVRRSRWCRRRVCRTENDVPATGEQWKPRADAGLIKKGWP
jgi:hypothetical protein